MDKTQTDKGAKLDEIVYTKNPDGSFDKTVTPSAKVENIKSQDTQREIEALEAQLADFAIGRSSDPIEQAKIDATILNYQEQLAILKN